MKDVGHARVINPVVTSPGKRERRKGSGFSRDELSEVALTFSQALNLGIPIDKRRRTKYDENVEALRQFLKTVVKREPKKVKKKAPR